MADTYFGRRPPLCGPPGLISLLIEDGEVERRKLGGIADNIDAADFSIGKREAKDPEEASSRRHNKPD